MVFFSFIHRYNFCMKQIIMQNYQLTIKIILQCCAFSYKIFVNYKNSLTVHENLNLKNFLTNQNQKMLSSKNHEYQLNFPQSNYINNQKYSYITIIYLNNHKNTLNVHENVHTLKNPYNEYFIFLKPFSKRHNRNITKRIALIKLYKIVFTGRGYVSSATTKDSLALIQCRRLVLNNQKI